MLDKQDMTPIYFKITSTSLKESIKKKLRLLFYPLHTTINDYFLEKKYSLKQKIDCNKLYLGQRGNDYEVHRKRVNNFRKIQASTILIIGVGTGKDLESWLEYNPKKIIAVDYFNYEKAWSLRKESFKQKYQTEIQFHQADILNLDFIKDNSVDIIGSDAVFEHINQFELALKELYRVLKPTGLLYATFGPLWHTWNGDHISGTLNLKNGYNHILYSKEDYTKFLDSFSEFSHSEEDGRTWIYNNLFSYLRPLEYLDTLERVGFKKTYVSCVLEQQAIIFKKKFPDIFKLLQQNNSFEDLIIGGMTIIYEKN